MTDEDALRAKIERLEAELEILKAQNNVQVNDGAFANGDKAKAVGAKGQLVDGDVGGDVIGPGGTLVKGDVYIGSPPKESGEALQIYRRVLCQATTSLPLRGIDVGASDPSTAQRSLSLVNVYVDLDTTAQAKIGEGKKARRKNLLMNEELEYHPMPVLKVTSSNRHLVLLGDPGSGKTTFVRFLAHCLAANHLDPNGGWLKHLPGWPKKEANILPIIVVLRDFASSFTVPIMERAEPRHLWEFITNRLKAQNLEFASDPIMQSLERGEALVLLDGLDEIPSLEQRLLVRDAVRAFIERYPTNRFLVTCRVLSYLPPESSKVPDLRLTELPDFTLAAFDEEKIDNFIRAWYAELSEIGSVSNDEARRLTNRLQDAIRQSDLLYLSSNPLLLTVIALVHTHIGQLPEARSVLYEEAVDLLLWRWDQVRLVGLEQVPMLRKLMHDASRSELYLKRVLWELAYEAQLGSQPDEKSGLADIGELRLQKALAKLKEGDLNWADQVIQTIKLRAGLLIERSPHVFTFPHRTFQEYLAGAHLAAQGDFNLLAAAQADKGQQWREVILFAVGRLVYLIGDISKPLALVGELCPSKPAKDINVWQRAWLAGDVLIEMGVNRVSDSGLGRDLLERVQARLAKLLSQGELSVYERTLAGDTLASLGDPRFDSENWYLPDEPLMGFTKIPAGPFLMGSDLGDSATYDDQHPVHEIYLEEYYIARFPVNVIQFKAFVEDSGYEPRDPESLLGVSNHPVVWVNWYDALAYCEWLNDKLRQKAKWVVTQELADRSQYLFWEGLANGKLRVTLPSEAEWEKAARGEDVRIYPWGNEYVLENANVEMNIGKTCAVGCYLDGASPYGVLDMGGNVWEWTRSIYSPYPYDALDGREDIYVNTDVRRVLRGGCWSVDHRFARCTSRYRRKQKYRFNDFGFRVVVSPA